MNPVIFKVFQTRDDAIRYIGREGHQVFEFPYQLPSGTFMIFNHPIGKEGMCETCLALTIFNEWAKFEPIFD